MAQHHLLVLSQLVHETLRGNNKTKASILFAANDLAPPTVNKLLQNIANASFAVPERVEQLLERHGLLGLAAVTNEHEQIKRNATLTQRQMVIFPFAYVAHAMGKNETMLTNFLTH